MRFWFKRGKRKKKEEKLIPVGRVRDRRLNFGNSLRDTPFFYISLSCCILGRMADFSSIPASSGQQQEAPCAHFACHFVWMRKKGERETKHERNIRERERKRELPCFVCWERIKVAKKVSSLSAGPYPSRWIVRMKKETRRRTFRLGV